MTFYLQPQPGSGESRCIGESGARKLFVRGARPARTSTSTLNTTAPRQGTVPFCFARCPAMVSIYLERS